MAKAQPFAAAITANPSNNFAMDFPLPAIRELGLCLENKDLVSLRLVDKHWNYIFLPLLFRCMVVNFPLHHQHHSLFKKYGKYLDTFHILPHFPSNDYGLGELMEKPEYFPNIRAMCTKLYSPEKVEALAHFCSKLPKMTNLKLFLDIIPTTPWIGFERLTTLCIISQKDNTLDIISNFSCPSLKKLGLVLTNPDYRILEHANTLFPNLELFHAASNFEAKTFLLSVNFKTGTIQEAYANLKPTHQVIVSFKRSSSQALLSKKALIAQYRDIQATLESNDRMDQLQTLLPNMQKIHLVIFQPDLNQIKLPCWIVDLDDVYIDTRLKFPQILSNLTFAAKRLTFSKLRVLERDLELIVKCFPNLQVLEINSNINDAFFTGSFPKLRSFICNQPKGPALGRILKAAPNCTSAELDKYQYAKLKADGFFEEFPNVQFKPKSDNGSLF
ncbi:hypothetical protein DSO57_1012723 [Entomophthora muscae]|uniref:Uncharacterized protein n=1 Tax=Entomophthora muscae TaxID=34485 RepID=A0ACC2T6D0_9FUNG|nr:hypothetical protein DSO57_1012723 [Entomophthora muscae]